MPGLVKVGRTTRRPDNRAVELSSSTGVASRFQLIYYVFVGNAVAGEHAAHEQLSRVGYRENEAREFFRIESKLAIDILASLPNQIAVPPPGDETSDLVDFDEYRTKLFSDALAYMRGTNGFPRDYEEAIRLFSRLVAMGCKEHLFDVADAMYWRELDKPYDRSSKGNYSSIKMAAKSALEYDDEACVILAAVYALEANWHNFAIYRDRFYSWLSSDLAEMKDGVIDGTFTESVFSVYQERRASQVRRLMLDNLESGDPLVIPEVFYPLRDTLLRILSEPRGATTDTLNRSLLKHIGHWNRG